MTQEEDNQSWPVLLEASLQEECSLQELRLLCRGQIIPEQMRVQVWNRLLGLSSASCLDNFNEIFDLSNQSVLREDCSKLVTELDNDDEDKVCILSDLESLITRYCKSHQIMYMSDSGWLSIMKVLISIKISKDETYNIFNAVLESYVPRNICGGAMSLFRLLLLYHDPELCSFLDSHKIAPDLYTLNWFSSLFGASSNVSAVVALWDYYFIHGDPFLIFFLSLVLLINAKDDIVSLKGNKEKILQLLAELPKQMEAADIQDFCSLAVLYSAQTPVSYKREYHQILFGERTDSFEEQYPTAPLLSQALCLPVSVHELLLSCKLIVQPNKEESEVRALRFFLVDCRPAEQYNAGHLPTAFHLDSNLMLTEPQAFNVAVQALLSAQKQSIAAQSAAGGEHLIFFGSGREVEDQYVHMVVAFFLQRHVQFVGLVQGGFEAVHQALIGIQIESGAYSNPADPVGLVDHNPTNCLVCRRAPISKEGERKNEDDIAKSATAKVNFFDKIRSRSAVVKEKLANYIVNPSLTSEHSGTASAKAGVEVPASSSKSKSSAKLYRNLAPIFSIDDDQGDEDATPFEGVSECIEDSHHQELVAISAWLKKPDVINSFRCSEVKESGHAYSSYLLITSTHLYVLREIQNRSGFARITVNRALTSIMKITSKKRHPEFITFKYGTVKGEETVITDMDRFVIPQAGDAVKLVKQQLFNSSLPTM